METVYCSDVNKDLTCKAKAKAKDLADMVVEDSAKDS